MLWFMRLQRVGHDWATELSWTELKYTYETVTLLNAADRVVNSQKHSLKKKKKKKKERKALPDGAYIIDNMLPS